MKTPFLTASLVLLALAGCAGEKPDAPTEAHFSHAMQEYLAKRGDLCVNRSSWPVDITQEEAAQGSRNTVQLPVLEKLGVVRSASAEVEGKAVRRYELTDSGRQYYLAREPYKRDTGHAIAGHDLCVARLTLKHVDHWEPAQGNAQEMVVSYTYDIQPAPWASNPDVRHVFPVIDHLLAGAGKLQLKESMVLTAQGWEAKDL